MRDIFWRILATVVLAVYIMATKIEFVAGAFPWLDRHSKLFFPFVLSCVVFAFFKPEIIAQFRKKEELPDSGEYQPLALAESNPENEVHSQDPIMSSNECECGERVNGTASSEIIPVNDGETEVSFIVKPKIKREPKDRILIENGKVIFEVEADGIGLKYQWYKNRKSISGATESSYTVMFGDAENYCVIVSNSAGSVISGDVNLKSIIQRNTKDAFVSRPSFGTENFIVNLPRGVKLEMIYVQPGTFIMGSPKDELGRRSNEYPHQVVISKAFWLGKYPVTEDQYRTIMRKNPTHFKGDNRPVGWVSWDDATNFCAKLTEIERTAGRLPDGYEYTLPTEAQWEYACRAGTNTALNSGKNLTDKDKCPNMDDVGWYYHNGGKSHGYTGGYKGPKLSGKKQPNAWGFCDMHGNVWEWCLDWFSDYPLGTVIDPRGAKTGLHHVTRGGSCREGAYLCRSAYRRRSLPISSPSNYGFRVALSTLVPNK